MTSAEARAAAALADVRRGAGGPVLPADIDPARVVDLLRANKVPLVEVDPGVLAAAQAWREALAREARQRAELAADLAEVGEALARDGIGMVLFKSAGGLPYRSSNVDVLVRPRHLERAADRLEELGHLRLPHYREEHKLLFRRFRKGRPAISVHLHEAVSWGRILILAGDDVVERARPPDAGESGFRVACAEDLLIVTLAHSLYETDQIRLSDLRAVRAALADAALDWERLLDRVRRHGWSAGFYAILSVAMALERQLYGSTRVPVGIQRRTESALEEARWARWYARRMTLGLSRGPTALPYPLSKGWSKLHAGMWLMRAPGRTPDEHLADLLATGWSLIANRLRLRCRPAAIVSVTGLDGSGKSSAVRAAREAMALCEVPVRVVWSRGGFTQPARALKRAARSVMGGRLPGPSQTAEKRRWLAGPLAGAAFASLVVVEQTVHYLLRVRMQRRLGLSLLCDRYAVDTLADLETKLGAGRTLSRAAATLVLAMAPEPDLAILLRLPPEEAARRKPGDAPFEVLEEQAAILERAAALFGLRAIDAARPDDEVTGEVVEMVLRTVFAKFAGARP